MYRNQYSSDLSDSESNLSHNSLTSTSAKDTSTASTYSSITNFNVPRTPRTTPNHSFADYFPSDGIPSLGLFNTNSSVSALTTPVLASIIASIDVQMRILTALMESALIPVKKEPVFFDLKKTFKYSSRRQFIPAANLSAISGDYNRLSMIFEDDEVLSDNSEELKDIFVYKVKPIVSYAPTTFGDTIPIYDEILTVEKYTFTSRPGSPMPTEDLTIFERESPQPQFSLRPPPFFTTDAISSDANANEEVANILSANNANLEQDIKPMTPGVWHVLSSSYDTSSQNSIPLTPKMTRSSKMFFPIDAQPSPSGLTNPFGTTIWIQNQAYDPYSLTSTDPNEQFKKGTQETGSEETSTIDTVDSLQSMSSHILSDSMQNLIQNDSLSEADISPLNDENEDPDKVSCRPHYPAADVSPWNDENEDPKRCHYPSPSTSTSYKEKRRDFAVPRSDADISPWNDENVDPGKCKGRPHYPSPSTSTSYKQFENDSTISRSNPIQMSLLAGKRPRRQPTPNNNIERPLINFASSDPITSIDGIIEILRISERFGKSLSSSFCQNFAWSPLSSKFSFFRSSIIWIPVSKFLTMEFYQRINIPIGAWVQRNNKFRSNVSWLAVPSIVRKIVKAESNLFWVAVSRQVLNRSSVDTDLNQSNIDSFYSAATNRTIQPLDAMAYEYAESTVPILTRKMLAEIDANRLDAKWIILMKNQKLLDLVKDMWKIRYILADRYIFTQN